MSGQKFGAAAALALVVGHFSGMLDLVALPVWVGALVERFGFSQQESGFVVTLYLLGAVAASCFAAPRLNKVNQKVVTTAGFALAGVAFIVAYTQSGFVELAIAHLLGGVSVGMALSMVHGTMGRSHNPHRLYAMANIAVGLLAIILLGALPQLLIAYGGAVLFLVFGCVMFFAALITGLMFPSNLGVVEQVKVPFTRAAWLTIFAISIMTFNQAMVFSFVEIIGKARGFSPESVLAVLIALGFVNFLVPAPLAAVLQTRISATTATQIGPIVQAVLALIVTMSASFYIWAPAAAIFVAVQIFTHTFAFGHLAKLDPTGRAVAATPAMLMIGAALGPLVGGALGQNFGYAALGIAAVFVGLTSASLFAKARTA